MKRLAGVALVLVFVASGLVGGSPAGAVNRGNIRRPGPIRVLLIGDSLTAFYQDRVQPLLGPGYQVLTGGVPGSSLLDADLCGGSRSQTLVNLYDPDIVVAEYVGNFGLLAAIGGTPICPGVAGNGTTKWFNQWSASARKNQKILKSRGARMIWTLVPSSTTHNWAGNYATAAPRLNAIYRKTAPKGTFVDLWTAFGGATFNSAMHDPDGLHLSEAGYDQFAAMVAVAVRG